MKTLFSKRSIISLVILTMLSRCVGSTDPFPYNIYPSLIVIGYSILMEAITHVLPYQRTIRLAVIWFVAVVTPPVWTIIGIAWLYGEKPPIASYDVALTAMWFFITIILYMYSIFVSLTETFRRKN
jgi:hypothetical protein